MPQDAPAETRRWPGLLAGTVGWLLVAGALLCLVARNVVSTRHLLIIAACGAQYSAPAGLLAGAVFALCRRWVGLLVAAAVSLALVAPTVPVLVRRAPKPLPGGQSLHVMTSNLLFGRADAAAVVQTARAADIGLLMLQELTADELSRLQAAGLYTAFPYHYVLTADGGGGIGLFSRYPLTDPRNHPDFSNHVLSAVVHTPGGTLTAFSSHLAAPWPQNAYEWKVESARLGAVLAGTSGPVIDAGDFNATSNLKVFRRLMAGGGVTDAARQVGAVSLRSYPADVSWLPPLLGIDHLLLRTVRAISLHTVTILGSDHRAVLADLSIPGPS